MRVPVRVVALSVVLGSFSAFGAPPETQRAESRGRAVQADGLKALPSSVSGIVTESPELRSEGPAAREKSGRAALDQPQCTICLGGAASATWTGSSGSFHVDRVANYRSSGVSGPLDVRMALTVNAPVWGQTISYYTFSTVVNLSPLAAGYQYAPVDSGAISYFGSSIPAGQYFLLMYMRENVSGTFFYVDWIQFPQKLNCTGSGCTVIQAPSCTEDALTMCLANGRYRVTGRWKNQYAGGAQANLSKTKLTDVTGAFWIANSDTYEFMARISTGTDNGKAWVSILTFTDVEFWVAITDVVNGQTKEYHSIPGNRDLIFDPNFFVYP